MPDPSTDPDDLEVNPGELAEAQASDNLPFLVVGVGSSAGGLEACTELLESMSANPGVALLLISHLDPNHKSHLAPILDRVCRMPVVEVIEGMAIEVDRVYVIPPGTNMEMTDGHLTLTPRSSRPVPHMPIDLFFRSLAEIQGARSVGVILSGNGSDGVIALQAIKAAGGVTFAQTEMSAKHPSMPRAAVLDGNIDHVLRPREIAHELERISRHPYTQGRPPSSDQGRAVEPSKDPIVAIIELLKQRTMVDFSHYKQSTIHRRIHRRMALGSHQDAHHYLKLLQADPDEAQALYQDFLIRVTQFFRDPDAFDALKAEVFPRMMEDKRGDTSIRIWAAGCSTGEEAYSLAMCLLEFLDGREERVSIKILATDLSEVALDRARAGVYLDNIELDVSPARLRRFFIRQDGHYVISKAVRELCIFSRHNMSNDPPFSRLDLVSCRNVLIYMDLPLQRQVLRLFHYSLNPRGVLLLGSAENVGNWGDLFDVVDAKNRLFRKSRVVSAYPIEMTPSFRGEGAQLVSDRTSRLPSWSSLDVQKEADRVLLVRFAPVGVVVDEAMTVHQFRGRTSMFLEPAPGLATLDLFRMLREGMLADVRSATQQARADNAVAVRKGVLLLDGDVGRTVRIEVIPFKVPPSGVRFFLVLFEDEEDRRHASARPDSEASPHNRDDQVVQLQQEINALREYLQSVIEEQESTNEELKSANEEILSANEELQSTNEELQTAKEEAQSTNEELATVNDELRSRNQELARVNDDLVNLLAGVNIPIVMVSRDLRIRRFTPLAEKLFNLIPSDVGRPLGHIMSGLRVDDLPGLIAGVIDAIAPTELDVQDHAGRWYSLRIRPYVTNDKKIDGASVVLIDIDKFRRMPDGASRDADGGAPPA